MPSGIQTGRKVGRPPKTIEQKRRTGNPGGRPLPKRGELIPLPAVPPDPVEPIRPLGPAGRQLWERGWAAAQPWLATLDIELLQVACEQLDERVALRVRVLRDGDVHERRALRSLDVALMASLIELGFTPVARARLGVMEVRPLTRLEEMRARGSS